ncbi:MAG: nucleoside transporter C-terminal domain-containing protein [Leptospiraceae bacterium]|nr:nucleoside transporter C-terminal domain-containing protein [Leptospiraceae bacterium]
MDIKLNFISLLGFFGFCFIAWISSENRKNFPWVLVLVGIVVQFILALLFFLTPNLFTVVMGTVNDFPIQLYDAADTGSRFLFGILVPDKTVTLPPLLNELTGEYDMQKLINPSTNQIQSNRIAFGYIFAFRSLPQIIFFSAIFALFYRFNLVQRIVEILSKIFQYRIKLSGREFLSGFMNIFFAVESLIIITPYFKKMTRSELVTVLTCCFGTASGTVLGIQSGFLRTALPNVTDHMLLASIITIPACFVISKIIVPEGDGVTYLETQPKSISKKESFLSSLLNGGWDGARVALGIIIGMIVVLGLVSLVNMLFSNLSTLQSNDSSIGKFFKLVSLENILGALFFPLTFLTGISLNVSELWTSSVIIGKRLFQTSIPSYIMLGKLGADGQISNRAVLILTYVLCGFAHIPAIGIFIGGLSGLVPKRSNEICSLAWKALWAATLATLMSGSIAGLFYFGA